jgi:hypothetical protein
MLSQLVNGKMCECYMEWLQDIRLLFRVVFCASMAVPLAD